MAFGANVNNVVINGQSIIKLTPHGGSVATLNFIEKPEVEFKPIDYKLTKGDVTCGYDVTAKFGYAQTQAADWTDATSARQLDTFQIIGPNDMFSVTNVFMNPDFKKTFSNTADSMINCTVMLPGVSPTNAASYLVASAGWS